MSEEDQIRKLVKADNSFKCTVKIKIGDGKATKVDSNTQDDNIKGLLAELKKEITECNTAKELVFKKSSKEDVTWTKES